MTFNSKPCEVINYSGELALIRQDERLLVVPAAELRQEEKPKNTRGTKKY